ncbi:MAG: serine/threonine-protein kinase [Planctomycetes bacterium]|jgi:serine/threonine-protein kinase|nr:serine/threonine-protein kinase [Planctomycetota bacterium]
MNEARFRRLKSVFQEVVDLPAAERTEALAAACRGDLELQQEVESLLAGNEDSAFLAEPALGRGFRLGEAMARLDTVEAGPYRSTALLGAGSSGIVYRAVHRDGGAEVALKVLRPGANDAAAIDALRREAEVLRRLDHPGIAKVLAVGENRIHGVATPWIAIELVNGLPLHQFVRCQALGLRDTLALMIDVAAAVQHAHEHDIVHNDLKPENVLVDDARRPVLVDFGLARFAAGAAADAVASAGGTPGYTAPERLRGSASSASGLGDVWSLGAMTYELLTGRLPLAWEGGLPRDPDRVEPWPLASLRPELRGPLATIVHWALATDPRHRCPSAGMFAAELRRFLAGVRIKAPRPGPWRRFRRFAANHRATVVGVVATFSALLLGMIGTSWALAGANVARAESERQRGLAEVRLQQAETERRRSEQLGEFLTGLLRAPLDSGDERPDLGSVFVDAAERLGRSLPADGTLQAGMCHALGMSLFALGRFDLAEQQLQQAVTLLRAEAPDDTVRLVSLQIDLAVTQLQAGRPAAALLLLQAVDGGWPPEPGPLDAHRLRCLYNLALSAADAGQDELAAATVQRALPWLEQASASDPTARLLLTLGARLASQRGDHAGAAHTYETLLQRWTDQLGDEHPHVQTMRNNLALELMQTGELARAGTLLERAIEGRRRRFGDDHPETFQTLHNLASVRASQGRLAEARALHEQAVAGRTRVLGADHPKTLVSRNNLARLLERLDDRAAAEAIYRDVLAVAERELPPAHWHAVVFRRNLGALLQDQGRTVEAEPLLRRSLAEAMAQRSADHPQVVDLLQRVDRLPAAGR